MTKALSRVTEYLRSNKFYRLILALFIFEASWIALSAAYPQAFDENFHFGLIKVYSHYWLPFLSKQPPHADAFGAVARDPSYLYHYLMSFPYRVIELFTKSQMAQVIALRFINIALFSYGIVLFRRILLRVGTSRALTNTILMLFVLIPIVPQLAGQINYDNLLMPLTAALILLAFRVTDEIRNKKVSIWSIAMLVGFGLLISLVKYAFLPIFVAIVLFLMVLGYRNYKHRLKLFSSQLLTSWKQQKRLAKVVIIMLSVVSIGMFIQRDGVNLVEYHNIQPDCSKVLSVKQCLAYSPWAYNYKNHLNVTAQSPSFTNPVIYAAQWAYWMWYRLFFAVNGPTQKFKNYPPLPLPSLAAIILSVAAVFALIKWWRKIFSGNIYLVLLSVITICYVLALFLQGYASYKYTDVLENMNGRYLLPIMLLAAAIAGQAISRVFRAQTRKAVFAVVIILLFLEGGGLFTFISRSDATWDVDNKTVVKVNDTARKVIKKVVVDGSKSYGTRLWFFN